MRLAIYEITEMDGLDLLLQYTSGLSASRAVVILREYQGLSYRDIADTLDIPIGTVMSRLNYARNRLRESLAPYLEAT